jgi:apolipoprotein N-acyltransferase
VPKRTSLTLATRLGGWPELLLVAIGVGGLGWAAMRSRRSGSAAG